MFVDVPRLEPLPPAHGRKGIATLAQADPEGKRIERGEKGRERESGSTFFDGPTIQPSQPTLQF